MTTSKSNGANLGFESKLWEMAALTTEIYEQFAKSDALEAAIKKNLEALTHGL